MLVRDPETNHWCTSEQPESSQFNHIVTRGQLRSCSIILNFEYVDKMLTENVCHSNESYCAVLSFSAVDNAVKGGSN